MGVGLWPSRLVFIAHFEGPMSRNRFLDAVPRNQTWRTYARAGPVPQAGEA